MSRVFYKYKSVVSLISIICILLSMLPVSSVEAEAAQRAASTPRYVWEKYNVTTTYTTTTVSAGDRAWIWEYASEHGHGAYTRINNTSYSCGTVGGTTTISLSAPLNTAIRIYFPTSSSYYGSYEDFLITEPVTLSLYAQDAGQGSYARTYNIIDVVSGSIKKITGSSTGKGTLVSTLSSSKSTAYTSGISGSYWYEYLGSDNIDPSQVALNTSTLNEGDTITATVTAGTGKKYEGTVSYIYQYSTDGGSSWTTANTTTATSANITVPDGSAQFQVRVYAKDNLGFTSSTYVYTDNMSVAPAAATITWDAGTNGGAFNDGTASTTTEVDVGDYATPPDNDPSKTGYDFIGWFTSNLGGVSFDNVSITEDITFYAQYAASNYSVTWDNGDGSSVVTDQTYDENLILPTTEPTKTGYQFNGWYTAKSGGTKVNASTVYKTAGNTTYYSQFSANSYDITWDDGQGNTQTTSQEYGSEVVLPDSEPSKTGYSFKGWYTAVSGGTKVDGNTIYQTAGKTTYYAQYEANAYTVTWDYGDGTSETISQQYDASLVLPKNEPTKDNWVFAGWYTDETGGTKVDANTVYTTAGDTTYYAQWIQVFSVTVPAALPVGMDIMGVIYTANAEVINNSSDDVKVSSVTVSTENGWSLVPYSVDMAAQKVDSKLVGFSLNGQPTTIFGTITPLTLTGDWIIYTNNSSELEYDAVISATSSPVSGMQILDVVFVFEWA